MEISGHTRLTALLGSPVSHSKSPLMHNLAFRLLNLDYVYLCFDVKEEGLKEAVDGLRRCGIRGFNLTMPLKTAIVPMLDSLSEAASLIGAVNTVVVSEDGCLSGHNTDGTGFMQSVRSAGLSMEGKVMTLLGSGGAATAICAQAALDHTGVIHLFSRSRSRFRERTLALADTINRTLSCRIILHETGDMEALKSCLSESSLLVNATSAGMAPDENVTLIEDTSFFHPSLTVADIVYNPVKTRLLRDAEEAHCRTINGLNMLLYQGSEAFRLFTGHDMPVEEVRNALFG